MTAEVATPNRWSDAIFRIKATLLQLLRAMRNLADGIRRHPQRSGADFLETRAKSATRLWTDTNPSEAWYQRGKIQNLRLAGSRLDGCVIPAGEAFSFWRQVGRASAGRGYAPGRMLQEGCMIPAVGGGLCQLSNAIYQVALEAGCEILERHPHSRVVPGSATAEGRDATVAWNYIDLRFRASEPLQLRVLLTAEELQVSLHARGGALRVRQEAAKLRPTAAPAIWSDHACESCGNTSCFRHGLSTVQLGKRPATAYLLDGAWPEFRDYVAAKHDSADLLGIPLDRTRWKKPQYAWPTEGFAAVHTATLATLARAAGSRRLAAQGAARQRSIMQGAAALAKELAKALTPDVDAVCVAQNLLPFLWRTGVLGGRRIRVLMTQLPIYAMEAALDRAYEAHPESPTLCDYRADSWLREAEEEALANVEQVVTPHAGVAALFPAKTVLLEWRVPAKSIPVRMYRGGAHPAILFPAATLGRKGAYELREALRGIEVELLLGGRVLEGQHFWDGFRVSAASAGQWQTADLAVLPSIVESQPRALLHALAAGVSVITTPESGLHRGCGARFVASLDPDGLRDAIVQHLETK